jgi:UDP-N-acetylglucosamine 2-epimerase (non-hydrolysing)
MTGLNIDRILNGLEILEKQKRGDDRSLRIVADYQMNNVSEKVARIILSYTHYVNKLVWRK